MARTVGPRNQNTLFDLEAPAAAIDPERERTRAEYRRRLAEKLKDPEFRKIEGFPIGTDEAILALSDPPHYTACPNPFLGEWLAEHARPYDPATDDYHREPFAADVSEGKNDPIYNAHSYHTKVPHKAIMRYILHYTQPGDVVYDGFCGTGMTGVAAQLCGDKAQVESLGYVVAKDSGIWEPDAWSARQALDRGAKNPHPHLVNPQAFSRLGARKAVLNDLSPAATFIAYNYNTPVDAAAFERDAKRVLAEVEAECGWMYTTLHGCTDAEVAAWAKRLDKCATAEEARELVEAIPSALRGRINYTVWSDVFVCPECANDIVFWDAAVDRDNGAIRDAFTCPSCKSTTTKRTSQRRRRQEYDRLLVRALEVAVQVPVSINYVVQRRKVEKVADLFDFTMADIARRADAKLTVPVVPLPPGFNTEQPRKSHGLQYVHQFYTPRNLEVLASARARGLDTWLPFSALTPRATRMHRIAASRLGGAKAGEGGATVGVMSGTLYVPSISVETNCIDQASERITTIARSKLGAGAAVAIDCSSATANVLKSASLDYVFTDPPFGGNLMYSELNLLWELWIGVGTNNREEAIENPAQNKRLSDYARLMTKSLEGYFYALKPGRWMTVEFHNSSNSVWNVIHEALEVAGFIVADVRVLDKKQFSFKQYTATGATKQDLVISCYKPTADFQNRFAAHLGQPEGVRDFLEQHLAMLPVAPVTKDGQIEMLSERTTSILYDRMIAYHLVRGAPIPLSAGEFTKLLAENFIDRDGMWFVPGQEARYDALKMRGVAVEQISIFVQDEKSAIGWVRTELSRTPMTLGELTPKFFQALNAEWPKTEPRPELKDLLRDSFIEDGDGRWHVPDPDNAAHLAKLRQTALLKKFREYADGTGKLATFRKEALLAGFEFCWNTRQYAVIVGIGGRIKPEHLQADKDLHAFVEIARGELPDDVVTAQTTFVWE